MRRDLDAERLRAFLKALGESARGEATVYLTGGATALLIGWRSTTVDVDLKLEPDRDEILRAIPRLKEELETNVELASPDGFLPELPGWRDRSPFVAREGLVTFRHYDFYAQALAKVERGHARDLADVAAMLDRGLVLPARLRELHAAIEPLLYRFPAVDPPTLRSALEAALAGR
ncbi:MAG TPA: hypothetical protein PKA62_10935 [Thermoanaerobaculia bacterium]|nr:hypothetical protein [Thermoanaerobaculia bacterium]